MSALLISISGRLCGLWYSPSRHLLNTIQPSLQHHYSVFTIKIQYWYQNRNDSLIFVNFDWIPVLLILWRKQVTFYQETDRETERQREVEKESWDAQKELLKGIILILEHIEKRERERKIRAKGICR